MKSHFYHIQINIDFAKNVKFYKDLMNELGWSIIFESDDLIGFKSSKNGDLWFVDSDKKESVDYDAVGINHLAIRVEKQKDIDQIVEFLKSKNITTLFGTPKHRADFAANENETYYQIILETPDKIQVEIVYVGEKE